MHSKLKLFSSAHSSMWSSSSLTSTMSTSINACFPPVMKSRCGSLGSPWRHAAMTHDGRRVMTLVYFHHSDGNGAWATQRRVWPNMRQRGIKWRQMLRQQDRRVLVSASNAADACAPACKLYTKRVWNVNYPNLTCPGVTMVTNLSVLGGTRDRRGISIDRWRPDVNGSTLISYESAIDRVCVDSNDPTLQLDAFNRIINKYTPSLRTSEHRPFYNGWRLGAQHLVGRN